jgi:DJ-1 family protein
MKVLAIIYEGFEEEEAVAPFALLRRAGATLDIASNTTTVKGSHNISLTDINLLKDINYKEYDCLIIPGGGGQFRNVCQSVEALNIIKYFYDNKKLLCGICAAPVVFGKLGILKGKNYTCFTSMNDDFGGKYHDKGVVKDGNLITARSVAYSIEFAYEIIKALFGEEKLKEVWEKIYYEK